MTSYPRASIDLQGIRENAARMKEMCEDRDIELTGVVKGSAGNLKVAEAFVEGGVDSLGDSRLRNIERFRREGIEAEFMLLRLPDPEEADRTVELADISLNSEIVTLKALSRAAEKKGIKHRVIIMVDVGDLREGIMQDSAAEFFSQALNLSGIDVLGLGTNVGCYGGVLPTYDNTHELIDLRSILEEKLSCQLPVISGGNTATTILMEKEKMPAEINNLRVGEGIIQGTDITHQRSLKDFNRNNITVSARIIELKEKPSKPRGELGRDAFGGKPEFKDKGLRRRAILAIGRQDVRVDGLYPSADGAEIIGASSDHLLVDVTDIERTVKTGDIMEFKADYGAMLAAMTSPYLEKVYLPE